MTLLRSSRWSSAPLLGVAFCHPRPGDRRRPDERGGRHHRRYRDDGGRCRRSAAVRKAQEGRKRSGEPVAEGATITAVPTTTPPNAVYPPTVEMLAKLLTTRLKTTIGAEASKPLTAIEMEVKRTSAGSCCLSRNSPLSSFRNRVRIPASQPSSNSSLFLRACNKTPSHYAWVGASMRIPKHYATFQDKSDIRARLCD